MGWWGTVTASGIAAVVGAIIGYYGNYLNNQWNYDHIYKPQLDAEHDRTTMEAEQYDKVNKALALAKDQFIVRVTEAVANVTALPGAERNRPVKLTSKVADEVLIPRARRIIDERDNARNGIRQVTDKLGQLSDALDSDIDDAKQIINNPPVDPQRLFNTLQRISDSWPAKQKLLDALAQAALSGSGCPVQVASNP
jgi:hypothetical protein